MIIGQLDLSRASGICRVTRGGQGSRTLVAEKPLDRLANGVQYPLAKTSSAHVDSMSVLLYSIPADEKMVNNLPKSGGRINKKPPLGRGFGSADLGVCDAAESRALSRRNKEAALWSFIARMRERANRTAQILRRDKERPPQDDNKKGTGDSPVPTCSSVHVAFSTCRPSRRRGRRASELPSFPESPPRALRW